MKVYLLLLIFIISELSANSYLNKAEQVLSGKVGNTKRTIIIPNCPYERCKNNKSSSSKVNINVTNYGLAISYFIDSIKKENSVLAAEKLIIFLSKQINYKEKQPDKILIKKLKNSTGLSIKQYERIVKFTISFLIKKEKCSGYYWLKNYTKGFIYKNEKNINVIDIEKKGKKICEKSKNEFYKQIFWYKCYNIKIKNKK